MTTRNFFSVISLYRYFALMTATAEK